MEHIPECAVKEIRPCPANYSLHSEEINEHWWSGWPGAVCMKCGDEDLTEYCIGTSCICPCHEEFWESYKNASNQSK